MVDVEQNDIHIQIKLIFCDISNFIFGIKSIMILWVDGLKIYFIILLFYYYARPSIF